MPALVAQCEYVQHRSGRRDSCHSVCAIFISHPQLWQHPRRAGPNLLRLFWRVVGSERNWGGTPAGPAVCLCHQLRLGPVHANSAEMLPWPHGDYRSSVRTHCTSPARSARQRQTVELASNCSRLRGRQRFALDIRAWLPLHNRPNSRQIPATLNSYTCKCSTRSFMSPSRVASGGGCRPDSATGIPSTPG